jgi:hypothetical protein
MPFVPYSPVWRERENTPKLLFAFNMRNETIIIFNLSLLLKQVTCVFVFTNKNRHLPPRHLKANSLKLWQVADLQ